MTKENRVAFDKFDDYLRLRQKEGIADVNFDIREWFIKNRYAQWNMGFVEENLKRKYAANLRNLLPNIISVDDKRLGKSSHYMISGTIFQEAQKSHKGAIKALQKFNLGDRLVLFEQGFLASSHSWSESFRSGDPKMACLGYVYDDMAHYFMTDYPNRLIHKLNSDHELSTAEIARVCDAIDRIVAKKISKYNSQPIVDPAMTEGFDRRVLVCDQAFADASVMYGRLTERDFEQMLLAAIRENPDAEILVKTHPDTHWEKGKRPGYFNDLQNTGRVRILRDPINPFCLFERVDKVYVGSSQMGLEALLAGKDVVCFGAPFYAGWGLTDDRQTIPHRHRARSLEELFHYFYIWYTIYQVPGCDAPSAIEDALDYIEDNRPVEITQHPRPASKNPKVSVILPVYGVERCIDQCLTSIREQTLEDIEIITVNDCSPDGSQAIIDRHAAEDARIKSIVLKQNVGQGFARNAGIEAALGEFIQFLDSDDFLATKEHLERVYKTACEDNADMVRGRKIFERLENDKGQKIGMRRDWCEAYFKIPFHAETLTTKPEIIKGRHFWNWLYRKQFLTKNNIRFLTGNWEEKPFLLKALLTAKSISSIDSEGFIYRIRVDSTARRKKSLQDAENQILNFVSLVDILKEHGAIENGGKQSDTSKFIITQFLNIVLFGFVHEVVICEEGDTGERKLFERLQRLLASSGMRASEVSSEPHQLKPLLKERNSYSLIFAAILAGKFEYARKAMKLHPVPQADYIAEMLQIPADDAEHQFQEALSLYARNDLVTTDSHVVSAVQAIQQKPRLIIHIGATKTGSTTIQHFLEKNRAALLRAGVYVPEVGLFWQKTRPHKQAGHAQFVPEIMKGKNKLKQHLQATQALCDGKIHTVILSSEAYFLNDNAIELARYFSDYDVEMITYLRRQDDWANSQYAEFVAGGAVGRVDQPIDEWLKTDKIRKLLDYYAKIKLWESVVDKSRIHIGIYDRKTLRDGDIISDFLRLSQLEDHSDLPRPAEREENRFPFGTAHVNLIRRLNKSNWSDRDAYFNFIEEAGRLVAKAREMRGLPAAKVNLLNHSQRRAIMGSVATTNAMLAQEFLDQENGALFDISQSLDAEAVDTISAEEFDAIMEAYDKWLPNHKSAGAKKPQNANKAIATPDTSDDITNDLLPINQTLIAKMFTLAGPRMKPQKFAKLKRAPDLFFSDMNWPGASLMRQVIILERRLRG